MGAVFTPASGAALKAAVDSCLSKTADGSCPDFAASNVPGTANPYGVIGAWDVSAVTSMDSSKCTRSLSLSVATAPSDVVYFNVYDTSSFIGPQYMFCYFIIVFLKRYLF